jgi:hypothetical protein
MTRLRWKPTSWARMPLAVRKAYMRYAKVFPGYDWSLCKRWDWFEPMADREHVYAVNTSGYWYFAKKTEGNP